MSEILRKLGRTGVALVGAMATAGSAFAQSAPAVTSGGWVAIAIIAGLVVLILIVIGGSLSMARRDKNDDTGMVGMLEGVDEDDEGKRG